MGTGPREKSMLHLVRLDGRGTYGWQFRVPSWHPQGPLTHYFSDARYGSSAKALAAARAYRDQFFAETGMPLRPKVQRPCGPVGLNNRSGLSGVFLQGAVRSGKALWCWGALWSEDKQPQKQRFYISTWGYEGAFWEAVNLRQKKTGVLFTNEALRQALAEGRLRIQGKPSKEPRRRTQGQQAPRDAHGPAPEAARGGAQLAGAASSVLSSSSSSSP